MNDFEVRASVEPVQVRSDNGKLVLSGAAIRYGARSRDLGNFRERIMPGAATEAIQKGDVLALHEHDVRSLLGRMSAGTLRLADSATELRYEVDLPDTTIGREVATMVERGDITGSSFGFRAVPSKVKWTVDDGMALRSVHGFRILRDISTTALPAYDETNGQLALRSFAAETGVEVEYRSVVAAAEAGDLVSLLTDRTGDTEEHTIEETTPPIRRRLVIL